MSLCTPTLIRYQSRVMLALMIILFLALVTCGCSKIEPEELGPGETIPVTVVTTLPPDGVPPAVTPPAGPAPLPRTEFTRDR